jgi:hypothetical protein
MLPFIRRLTLALVWAFVGLFSAILVLRTVALILIGFLLGGMVLALLGFVHISDSGSAVFLIQITLAFLFLGAILTAIIRLIFTPWR